MLRTRNLQPSLWESVLPEICLRLPGELERIDAWLDDEAFFAPFVSFFDPHIGRPSVPMETYLRLMFLKFRVREAGKATLRRTTRRNRPSTPSHRGPGAPGGDNTRQAGERLQLGTAARSVETHYPAVRNPRGTSLDRAGRHTKPRVHESTGVKLRDYPGTVRQLIITGLGRDTPTVIITNDHTSTAKQLIERYARRMGIEQRLAEIIRSQSMIPTMVSPTHIVLPCHRSSCARTVRPAGAGVAATAASASRSRVAPGASRRLVAKS
jgi:hypothetical protein